MPDYPPPSATNILLAVSDDVEERFRRILSRHHLTSVVSTSEAMLELEDDCKMAIISVHFDETQMFSLLGDIRAHSAYRKMPVLCVLGSRGWALSDVAVEGLDHAVKAMRANGFLDLQHFDDDEAGNARIARIVDYLLLIDGDLQHIARATGEPVMYSERRRAR